MLLDGLWVEVPTYRSARRVLELRLAGLRTREIADALGISQGAVRAAQHRAARRLRPILRPHDQNGDNDGAE